jgi:hypothetical protein
MKKIKNLLSEESLAVLCLTIVILVSFYIFHSQDKWDALPPFFLTCVTAIFSFFAYKHAKEKFRLDLMEKRLEVYKNLMTFCSVVMTEGSLIANDQNGKNIERGHKAAHESFRGSGWHQTRILFGDDIETLFQQLNNSYSWLVSFDSAESYGEKRNTWAKDRTQHLKFIIDTNTNLPNIFKPYIYFGFYKNENITNK